MSFLIAHRLMCYEYYTISQSVYECMSQPVAHTQDFLLNNNKNGAKRNVYWLLITTMLVRYFSKLELFLLYVFAMVVGWQVGRWWWGCTKNLLLWMNTNAGQKMRMFISIYETRKQYSYSKKKIESVVGCSIYLYLLLYRSILSNKFSHSDKCCYRCCLTLRCLHNIASAHSIGNFCWN